MKFRSRTLKGLRLARELLLSKKEACYAEGAQSQQLKTRHVRS
jgi:hypothetical protein